jgi:hypothetical protein
MPQVVATFLLPTLLGLEHAVVVCWFHWKRLHHIPMLNQTLILHTENIYHCLSTVGWVSFKVAVHHNEVAFGNKPFKLEAQLRVWF